MILAKASNRELQLALSKHNHEFSSADFNRWTSHAAVAVHSPLKTIENQEPKSAMLETAFRSATPTTRLYLRAMT